MTGLRRHYTKLCDIHDFDDPELLRLALEIVPGRDERTVRERKLWEYAMLGLFLADAGRLGESTEVLSVAAGAEEPLYWLANRVGRVVATDIYGEGSFAGREAAVSMLDDPAAHAPYPYREDRLEVRYMNALELEFPDESFDVVYSLSSIEHFGSPSDVARAAAEIGRVLRPGGHAFVVTECFVKLHPRNTAPVDFYYRVKSRGRALPAATPRRRVVAGEVFKPRELRSRIVRPSGLRLMQALDTSVSPESWGNVCLIRPGPPEVTVEPASGDYYPHVLLQVDRSVFTSVCLPLQKPGPGI